MRTAILISLLALSASAGINSTGAADTSPQIVRVTDVLNAAHYPALIVTIEFADGKWNGSVPRQWGDWSAHGETLTGDFHKGDGTANDPDSVSIDGLKCLNKGPESAQGPFTCSIVLFDGGNKKICGILAMGGDSNANLPIACPVAMSLIKR